VQVQPPASLLTACRQIVQCLIENVLRLEETTFESTSETMTPKEALSQRLVACLTTLYLLAKIRPQLLIDHATTLQPYLSLKCKVIIIIYVFNHIFSIYNLSNIEESKI
jgi:cohesin loading factor subunit SCC2